MTNLRISQFEYQSRQGFIVYLTKLKYIKYLKRYGLIHYVSKKMKYVVLYTETESINEVMQRLRKLKYVRKVELSHLAELDIEVLEKSPKEE